ncbi:hypothetical protein Plhal304r1_c022g0078451 [Plasmopara halstedii]
MFRWYSHSKGNMRADKTVRLAVTQEQLVWEANAALSHAEYDVAIGKLNAVNPAAAIYLSVIPAKQVSKLERKYTRRVFNTISDVAAELQEAAT